MVDYSKRRKTVQLSTGNKATLLLYAFQMALRDFGNISGAQVVKYIIKSTTCGNKYESAVKKNDSVNPKLLS